MSAACLGATGSAARVAALRDNTSSARNGPIAYATQRVKAEANRLYVMDATGVHQHPLGSVRDVSGLSWSPDSRWLLFAMGNLDCSPGGGGLYLMRADGSGLRQLTHDRMCYAVPSWAPDGKQIACASWRPDGLSTIWVMHRDGTHRHQLTKPGTTGTADPAWSPSGHTIAFVAGDPGVVWLMDADGRNQRPLTRFRGHDGGDGDPAWSPNGKWIAFDRAHSLRGVWHTDIYQIRPDGTGARQLTDRRGHLNEFPDWSPDGARIVFASDRQRRHEMTDIYVMDADGSDQRPLTNSGLWNEWPAWEGRR